MVKTLWWEGGWTDRKSRVTSVARCINKVRRPQAEGSVVFTKDAFFFFLSRKSLDSSRDRTEVKE